MPRNAVRKTLAQLEAEGCITRHVGLLVAAPVPYQHITGQAINPLLIF